MPNQQPDPFDGRVALAHGELAGWPWTLEAWLEVHDLEGDNDVHYTLRCPLRHVIVRRSARLGKGLLAWSFVTSDDGGASVLAGPIAPAVESVLVRPHGGSYQPTTIVEHATLGRYFCAPFTRRVEQVDVALEPTHLASRPYLVARDFAAEDHRMDREARTIGAGCSPEGRHWELRVWNRDPGTRRVAVYELEKDGVWRADAIFERGPDEGELVYEGCAGGRLARENHWSGGADPSVATVRLLFVDGGQIDATLLLDEVIEERFWVVSLPPDASVVRVLALDDNGSTIGEDLRYARRSASH